MTTPEQAPSGSGLQAQPATLAEWLTAQLDREEAAARAATPGPWKLSEPQGNWIWPHVCNTYGSERVNAEHIAYWDPARVLADIAAKRGIVAEYVAIKEARLPAIIQIIEVALFRCLRLLAQPYAGQSGFDPAWVIS